MGVAYSTLRLLLPCVLLCALVTANSFAEQKDSIRREKRSTVSSFNRRDSDRGSILQAKTYNAFKTLVNPTGERRRLHIDDATTTDGQRGFLTLIRRGGDGEPQQSPNRHGSPPPVAGMSNPVPFGSPFPTPPSSPEKPKRKVRPVPQPTRLQDGSGPTDQPGDSHGAVPGGPGSFGIPSGKPIGRSDSLNLLRSSSGDQRSIDNTQYSFGHQSGKPIGERKEHRTGSPSAEQAQASSQGYHKPSGKPIGRTDSSSSRGSSGGGSPKKPPIGRTDSNASRGSSGGGSPKKPPIGTTLYRRTFETGGATGVLWPRKNLSLSPRLNGSQPAHQARGKENVDQRGSSPGKHFKQSSGSGSDPIAKERKPKGLSGSSNPQKSSTAGVKAQTMSGGPSGVRPRITPGNVHSIPSGGPSGSQTPRHFPKAIRKDTETPTMVGYPSGKRPLSAPSDPHHIPSGGPTRWKPSPSKKPEISIVASSPGTSHQNDDSLGSPGKPQGSVDSNPDPPIAGPVAGSYGFGPIARAAKV